MISLWFLVVNVIQNTMRVKVKFNFTLRKIKATKFNINILNLGRFNITSDTSSILKESLDLSAKSEART